MQPVNDDMDNLFRRAAESYPLKSDGADFDKIRQQLDAENELPEKKKKERKYLWFLLLLLIPLTFLFQKYYTIHIGIKDQHKERSIVSENSKALDNKEQTPMKNISDRKPITNDQSKYVATLTTKNKQPITTVPGTINNTNHTDKYKELTKNKNYYSSNTSKAVNRAKKNDKQLSIAITKRKTFSNSNAETILQSYKSKRVKKETSNLIAQKDGKLVNQLPIGNTKEIGIIKETSVTNPITKTADSVRNPKAIKTTPDSSKNTITKFPADSLSTTASKKIIDKKKIYRIAGLYIGIAGGPDASTVKSNKSSGAGYNVGFIAGYHIGKHLSVETGVLWNYKKYYSDGRNVATDKLDLYTHSQIVYLDGTCGMIEIPISIQYHFNMTGNHNWYVGTGLSSYIMKKENYDYLYNRYNMQYYGQKEYTNTTTNWLSVLQFNIGYQVKLTKAINLRMEPYAKLPLKGLGIGKLPISSVGANVGFTIPIH